LKKSLMLRAHVARLEKVGELDPLLAAAGRKVERRVADQL
jgi:hypothetical protein